MMKAYTTPNVYNIFTKYIIYNYYNFFHGFTDYTFFGTKIYLNDRFMFN